MLKARRTTSIRRRSRTLRWSPASHSSDSQPGTRGTPPCRRARARPEALRAGRAFPVRIDERGSVPTAPSSATRGPAPGRSRRASTSRGRRRTACPTPSVFVHPGGSETEKFASAYVGRGRSSPSSSPWPSWGAGRFPPTSVNFGARRRASPGRTTTSAARPSAASSRSRARGTTTCPGRRGSTTEVDAVMIRLPVGAVSGLNGYFVLLHCTSYTSAPSAGVHETSGCP